MNPQHNEASGMQLPPPIMERGPADASAETQPANAEQASAAAELQGGKSFAPAAMPASIPLPTTPSVQFVDPTAASSTTQASTVLAADDGDLIEREWVLKAKAIVERTSDDPYRQTEELTAVKADYMKQRYNKSIKLSK